MADPTSPAPAPGAGDTVRKAVESMNPGLDKDSKKTLGDILKVLQEKKKKEDQEDKIEDKKEEVKKKDELIEAVKSLSKTFDDQFKYNKDKDSDERAKIKSDKKEGGVKEPRIKEPDSKKKGLFEMIFGTGGAIGQIVDGIIKLVKSIVDIIMTVVKNIIEIVGSLGKAIGKFIGGIIGGIGEGLGTALKALGAVPPQALLVFAAVLGILVAAFWGVVAIIKFGGKELREFIDIMGDQLVKVLNSLKGFNASSVAALVLLGPGIAMFAFSLMYAAPALLALAAISLVFEKLSGGKNLGKEATSPIFNFIGGIVDSINEALPDPSIVLQAAKIMVAVVVIAGAMVAMGYLGVPLMMAVPGILLGSLALKISAMAIVFMIGTFVGIFTSEEFKTLSALKVKPIFEAAGVMGAIAVFNLAMILGMATAIPMAAIGVVLAATYPVIVIGFIAAMAVMEAFGYFYDPKNNTSFETLRALKVKPIFEAAGVMGAIAVFNLAMIVAMAASIPIAAIAIPLAMATPLILLGLKAFQKIIGSITTVIEQLANMFADNGPTARLFKSLSKMPSVDVMVKTIMGTAKFILAFGPVIKAIMVLLPFAAALKFIAGLKKKSGEASDLNPFENIKFLCGAISNIVTSQPFKDMVALNINSDAVEAVSKSMIAILNMTAAVSVAAALGGSGVLGKAVNLLIGSMEERVTLLIGMLPYFKKILIHDDFKKLFLNPPDVPPGAADKITASFASIVVILKSMEGIIDMANKAGGMFNAGDSKPLIALIGSVASIVTSDPLKKLLDPRQTDWNAFNNFVGVQEDKANNLKRTFEVLAGVFSGTLSAKDFSSKLSNIKTNLQKIKEVMTPETLKGLNELVTSVNQLEQSMSINTSSNVQVKHTIAELNTTNNILRDIERNTNGLKEAFAAGGGRSGGGSPTGEVTSQSNPSPQASTRN